MPTAEINISTELVNALIRSQHPDLAAPLRRVANGWDNVIFRLGDDLAVRLPRRAVAVTLLEHEQRWLSVLAPQVTVPIPVPVRQGEPDDTFPWPWSITPWFDGHPLVTLPVRERRPYAGGLGRFLGRLHTAAPPGAPPNPVRGIPLSGRAEVLARHLETTTIDGRDALKELWEVLVATPPWSGHPLWLHGDPHPGNVLVRSGTLAAMIDFGDLTAGDPATDLAAAWLTFDSVARRQLRAAYAQGRPEDDDTWARARGWALCLGVALIANSDDNPVLDAVGRHALAEVLTEDR